MRRHHILGPAALAMATIGMVALMVPAPDSAEPEAEAKAASTEPKHVSRQQRRHAERRAQKLK